MTDLAQLINDLEAHCKCRVQLGVPMREEVEFPHPCRTKTCVVLAPYFEGDFELTHTKLHNYLLVNADRYGFYVTGSYIVGTVIEEEFNDLGLEDITE